MNGAQIGGLALLATGAFITLGFFGPLNPSCGSGLFSFLTSALGLCISYAPFIGLAVISIGIILMVFSNRIEGSHGKP